MNFLPIRILFWANRISKKNNNEILPFRKRPSYRLSKGEVEAINAVTPHELEKIKTNNNIKTLYLPRIFGVFLNQNSAKVLTKKKFGITLELIR